MRIALVLVAVLIVPPLAVPACGRPPVPPAANHTSSPATPAPVMTQGKLSRVNR